MALLNEELFRRKPSREVKKVFSPKQCLTPISNPKGSQVVTQVNYLTSKYDVDQTTSTTNLPELSKPADVPPNN